MNNIFRPYSVIYGFSIILLLSFTIKETKSGTPESSTQNSYSDTGVQGQLIGGFTYSHLGNQFSFVPLTENIKGSEFYWEFGEKMVVGVMRLTGVVPTPTFFETSESPFPVVTFPIGTHRVFLRVTDKTSGEVTEETKYVTVEGVEDYYPKIGGSGGSFDLRVSGAGLTSTTEISLIKGSTTLTPSEVYASSSGTTLTAIFDFHTADTGAYDVVIQTLQMDEPAVFENGLKINSLIYPVTFSEIAGGNQIRTGRNGYYNLMIYNKGNVTASGVVVALAWPKELTLSFTDGYFGKPLKTGIETVEVDGEIFSLNRSEYMDVYDSLDSPTPIDTFNLQPYDGYVKYILVPHVPANGWCNIRFKVFSPISSSYELHTYTLQTNQWGSPANPVYNDHSQDLTAELIDAIDMAAGSSNMLPLEILTKTAKIGQRHGASMASYAGKKFWSWWDGYEFDSDGAMRDWMAETEANNAFALQTATDEIGNLIFDKASAKLISKYSTQGKFACKRLTSNPNLSAELSSKYLKMVKDMDKGERLEKLKKIYKTIKDLGTLKDKLQKLQKLVKENPELAPQLEELKKALGNEFGIVGNREKRISFNNSADPNMIVGPDGSGENHYLNNTDPQSFTIHFENMPTATAAAQIVRVYDTLDVNKYDLSTFSFGHIGIGNKQFRLPVNQKEFSIERNIEQTIPVKVRISGKLDESTGVITWQFVSIDTTTDLLPEYDGFLPPNINSPEGQGSVSFTVNPKGNLTDGTLFENKATIIFDQNDPITTNVWKNVLDIGKPSSMLSAKVTEDTLIRLDFSGNDAVSGMGYYNLFVKVNSGDWVPYGGTSLDSLILTGEVDSTYSFYVSSLDKVGNEENKAPGVEDVVTISKSVLNIRMDNLIATNISENKNQLNWNTYSEDAGDYFEVERSKDGHNFITLSKIVAKGTPSLYEYIDAEPISGYNYYRLKIFNNNGEARFSNIVVVRAGFKEVLTVYPNPVSQFVMVQIAGKISATDKIIIYNMSGQKVTEHAVTENNEKINIQKLTPGVYFLVYQTQRNTGKFKIIKE